MQMKTCPVVAREEVARRLDECSRQALRQVIAVGFAVQVGDDALAGQEQLQRQVAQHANQAGLETRSGQGSQHVRGRRLRGDDGVQTRAPPPFQQVDVVKMAGQVAVQGGADVRQGVLVG